MPASRWPRTSGALNGASKQRDHPLDRQCSRRGVQWCRWCACATEPRLHRPGPPGPSGNGEVEDHTTLLCPVITITPTMLAGERNRWLCLRSGHRFHCQRRRGALRLHRQQPACGHQPACHGSKAYPARPPQQAPPRITHPPATDADTPAPQAWSFPSRACALPSRCRRRHLPSRRSEAVPADPQAMAFMLLRAVSGTSTFRSHRAAAGMSFDAVNKRPTGITPLRPG